MKKYNLQKIVLDIFCNTVLIILVNSINDNAKILIVAKRYIVLLINITIKSKIKSNPVFILL